MPHFPAPLFKKSVAQETVRQCLMSLCWVFFFSVFFFFFLSQNCMGEGSLLLKTGLYSWELWQITLFIIPLPPLRIPRWKQIEGIEIRIGQERKSGVCACACVFVGLCFPRVTSWPVIWVCACIELAKMFVQPQQKFFNNIVQKP